MTDASASDITEHVRDHEPAVLDLLPLPAAALYILTVLGNGPMHGYGLMSEIRSLSDGTVTLGPGTLYGSIKRMIDGGLIEESGERPDPALDDQRRRYYRLTHIGGLVARAEADRLSRLVTTARQRRLVTYGESEITR